MKQRIIFHKGASSTGKGKKEAEEEGFKITHVFEAFTSLPRVLRLVWSTDARLTAGLAFISLLRGSTPAITVYITKMVIDSVVLVSEHIVSPPSGYL